MYFRIIQMLDICTGLVLKTAKEFYGLNVDDITKNVSEMTASF